MKDSFFKIYLFLIKDIKETRFLSFEFILLFAEAFIACLIFFFINKIIKGAGSQYIGVYKMEWITFFITGRAVMHVYAFGMNIFPGILTKEKNKGSLEAMISAEPNVIKILFLSAFWPLLLNIAVFLSYFVFAVLFFNVEFSGINIFPFISALFLLIFCSFMISLFVCSLLILFQRGMFIVSIILRLSVVLGGVIIPVSVFPLFLRRFCYLLPITPALEIIRRSLSAGFRLEAVAGYFGILIILTIFSTVMCVPTVFYAVKRARLEGSLSHY